MGRLGKLEDWVRQQLIEAFSKKYPSVQFTTLASIEAQTLTSEENKNKELQIVAPSIQVFLHTLKFFDEPIVHASKTRAIPYLAAGSVIILTRNVATQGGINSRSQAFDYADLVVRTLNGNHNSELSATLTVLLENAEMHYHKGGVYVLPIDFTTKLIIKPIVEPEE